MCGKYQLIQKHSYSISDLLYGFVPRKVFLWLVSALLVVFPLLLVWSLYGLGVDQSLWDGLREALPLLFFLGLFAFCLRLVLTNNAKFDAVSASVGVTGSSNGIVKSVLLDSFGLICLLLLMGALMVLRVVGIL